MKNHGLIVFAALIVCSCTSHHSSVKNNKSIPDTQNIPLPKTIDSERESISVYFQGHRNKVIAFAKLKGKDSVIKIEKGDRDTHNVVCYYNIWKDTTGKIILIRCMPFSETNNWWVEYNHYFNAEGKTIVFEGLTNTQNNDMDADEWHEVYEKAFDTNFKVVGKYYYLGNRWDKKMKYTGQLDSLRFTHTIYKNVDECLAGYHIDKTRL